MGDQTLASLKEENDSLRWQLDAYRNEVELLKKEQSRISRLDDDHAHPQALTHANSPEAQIQLLQQSMHSMQQVGCCLWGHPVLNCTFSIDTHNVRLYPDV